MIEGYLPNSLDVDPRLCNILFSLGAYMQAAGNIHMNDHSTPLINRTTSALSSLLPCAYDLDKKNAATHRHFQPALLSSNTNHISHDNDHPRLSVHF
jgi:hypothetical protein